MDAIDEDDFISVLFEMKHREFKPHIEEVKEWDVKFVIWS